MCSLSTPLACPAAPPPDPPPWVTVGARGPPTPQSTGQPPPPPSTPAPCPAPVGNGGSCASQPAWPPDCRPISATSSPASTTEISRLRSAPSCTPQASAHPTSNHDRS